MNLHKLLSDAIDEARSDIWETDDVLSLNEPTDNHGRVAARQSAQAEIWGAIMDYREERIDFDELLMSLQAFDPEATPQGVSKILKGEY